MTKNYISLITGMLFLLSFLTPRLSQACQMGCKQFTQISLGIDCVAEVTSDILLSGANDCTGPFEVQVMFENMQPVPGSPFLGPEHVGMTLMASVLDTDSGNQCMVTIFVEDKYTPDLICGTTEVSCDAFTGFSVPNQIADTDLWMVNNSCQDINIPVAGISDLSDINLALSFAFADASDVEINLTSPDGTIVELLDGNDFAGCTNSEFSVLFDDHALLTNSDLVAACAANESTVLGNYQPKDALEAIFADANYNGNWILTICAGAASDLVLTAYTLQLSETNIIIPFPVTAGSTVQADGDDYVVTGFDSCGPATLSYTDDENDESCDSEYQQTILRNWLLTDGSGNTDACVQTIHVERRAPSEIVIPPNYFPGQPGPGPLACEDKMTDPGNAIIPNIGWNALANGHPSPYDEYYPAPNDNVVKWYGTGTPALGACEDLSILYEDTRINVCPTGTSDGCFTIKRRWMVFEHCTGIMAMEDQLIKVMDIIAPTIAGLEDFTVNILQDVCMAGTYAPLPILTDNCSASADLTYTFSSSQGDYTYIPVIDQYYVENLPPGVTEFTYTASDCCGNSDSQTISVTVIDNAPPNVVCKDAQVNLTIDGCGKIYPESIDDGSNDNCSDTVYFKIIRMDDLQGSQNGSLANQLITSADVQNGDDSALFGNQILFDSVAFFCCEDIGDVLVVLRAFDVDPGPGPVAPSRMEAGGDLFGHYNDCMRTVKVSDKLPPLITCPGDVTLNCDQDFTDLTLTGTAIGTDNCETPIVDFTDVESLNACGEGMVTRTWTAADANGRITSCEQIITLEDNTDPVITYPADITVNCSDLDDLNVTGIPTVMDDCDLIGFSHNDDLPIPLQDQCGYRIVRRWSGWSLCDNTQQYMGTQTIISIDTTAPVLVGMVDDVTVSCAADVPDANMISVTDNCSIFNPSDLFFNETITPLTCVNNFSILRTWIASDSCGNMSTITQSILVNDDVPPVLSILPADFTLACGEEVPMAPMVTATDNCDTIDPNDIVLTETSGTMFCTDGLVRTRVWTVTDACGNPASVTRRYFQPDNEDPMFVNPPADVVLACNEALPSTDIVATDDCTATVDLIIDLVETVSNSACIHDFTLTRVWTVTDGCGKTAMHTQVITVIDNEEPVFVNPPGDVNLGCDEPLPSSDLMATDDCTDANDLTINLIEVVSDSTCIFDYTLTRTWTVTDDCGKMAMHTQVIVVTDNAAPMFVNPPASINLSCTDPIPTALDLEATDDCTPADDLEFSFSEIVSDSTCIYDQTITRLWSVTDVCGKTTTHEQVITIMDNAAPIFINPPANINLSCTDPIPAALDLAATDDCTPADDLEFSFSEVVSDSTCVFDQTITRLWSVTDVCGKTTTHEQVITIMDNAAPMFVNPPGDLDLECMDPIPPVPTLSATDDCTPDNELIISFMQSVMDSVCVFSQTITREWTVTDLCGKSTTHTQVIMVGDSEDPMFVNPPGNLTLTCNDPIPPASIVVSDDCTATDDLEIDFSEVTSDSTCVYTKTITRMWTVTDLCGKTAMHTQVITIADSEAPVFTFTPADISISCDEILVLEEATATDNCELVSLILSESTSTLGCEITTVRTWTATDRCGLTNSAVQTVVVFDIEAPEVDDFPSDITVSCGQVPIVPTLLLEDNCDDPNEITSVYSQDSIPGSCIHNYVLERTWVLSDACGNMSTQTYSITVMDMEDPVFVNFPDDIALVCIEDTTPLPGTIFVGPTATDDCGTATVTFSDVSVMGMGNCQMITRTWTATDICGNSINQDQIITFTDDLAPQFNMDPSDITIECDEALPSPLVFATDNCELMSTAVVELDTVPGFCANTFTITRSWTAVDLCGNMSSVSQEVLVQDTERPMVQFELPGQEDITIECGMDVPPVPNILFGDNCSPTDSIDFSFGEVILTPENDQDFGITVACPTIFIVQRTWLFVDQCGNSESLFQEISVDDTTDPLINLETTVFNNIPCETDITPVEGGPYAPPTVTEACSSFTLNFNDIMTGGPCTDERTVLRNWTAIDSCGNVSMAQQTFNFVDDENPVIVCPDDINVGIGGTFFEPHQCEIVLDLTPGSLSDNCDLDVMVGNSINADIGGISTFAFPIGITPVTFTATDNCGNEATCDFIVDVDDIRPPTAIFNIPDCFVLGPENELIVEISSFASFVDCSFDTAFFLQPEISAVLELDGMDIGQPLNILIAFSDTSGNSSVFGNNPIDPIEVYAFGTMIDCGPTNIPTAAGKIMTPLQDEIKDVQVYIEEIDEMAYTNEEGVFEIFDEEVGPGYTFHPRYNERIREGLSTLDIVLISRHLIGLQPITEPHRLIAADVNYSGQVDAFDLIDLQKVLLWIYDEFPNGDAWRFVDENFLFPLSGNPFSSPFPEMIMIDETLIDYMHLNFTAIKLGDVNASLSASPQQLASERAKLPRLDLRILDQSFIIGQELQVPVYVSEEVFSHGFDLELNASEAIGSMEITEGQINPATSMKDGRMLMQWVAAEGQQFRMDQPLFYINITAQHTGNLRTDLWLSDDYFTNTAFAADKSSHAMVLSISPSENISVANDNYHPIFYPNVPNPFRQETTLRFYVPESGEATLQITNLDGRVIYRSTADYQKGYHEQVLKADQLPGGGVLQCQLVTNQGTVTQKMLLIKD